MNTYESVKLKRIMNDFIFKFNRYFNSKPFDAVLILSDIIIQMCGLTNYPQVLHLGWGSIDLKKKREKNLI